MISTLNGKVVKTFVLCLCPRPYDKVYISTFQFDGTKYFTEHNVPLSNSEIGGVVGFVAGALDKIKIDLYFIKENGNVDSDL